MEIVFSFIKSAITIMIPLFFAAAGGLFSALAGCLNIALEGLLLIGAFSSLTVFYFTGNIAATIFAGIIASMFLAFLHAFTSLKLNANLFITGIAINLFSSGLCIVLSDKIFNTKGVIVAPNSVSLLNLYIIFGLILLVLSRLAIFNTPFGYRLRACDKNTDALLSLGIKMRFYQMTSLLISGFFCGLGGAFLSLNLGAYVPQMSAGRGWIALAVIFLGAKKPFGVLAAAFIFALAETFSNYAQGFWNIPSDFILAFPYICTLFVMIIVSIMPKNRQIFI